MAGSKALADFEALKNGIESASAKETQQWGERFGMALVPGQVVCLHGDLGAGKTTFVQGVAAALGITQAVTSPTFAILNTYQGRQWQLVHMDAYRLESTRQAEALLLEDFLHEPWVLLIEWPERAPEDWLEGAWQLHISSTGEQTRNLRLSTPGASLPKP
jgi:tRNA threonylcarbamoyladenosine biosynthesis protein TsaE